MIKKYLFRIVLFIGMFFVFTGFASAATVYTNSSTGNDTTGDGTPGTPYATFHKAYTMSSSGDTINATGTFDWTDADETGDATTTGYTIEKDLTIQGAGPSTTIFQAASADNTANMRVFTTSTGTTVTFNDMTIRYGRSTSSSYGGGGLLIYGTATIDGADIGYNRASNDSGGGADVRGQLTIQNSAIHHNVAHYTGGGLNRSYYSASGGTPDTSDTLDIINCTISNNTVTQSVAYLEGGGVFYRRGYGSITNSTISYNQVVNGGTSRSTHGLGTGDGAGTIKLKNNIIANNILSTSGGDIGHRENGYGVYEDNGGNIIGRVGYYSSGYTPAATSWVDATSYSTAIDGTYVFQDGGSTSGTLNLDNMLQTNGNTANGTKTLGVTSGSSIAVDNGLTGTNGTVNVPTTDQREVARVTSTDIGAYEVDGTYATETPSTQAYSLVYSNVQNSRMTVGWTVGSGLYRIVFVKAVSSGTASPVDATTYTANAAFGSGTQIGSTGWYAVYAGTGTSVTVTGLSPGTDYIAQVFEYNGHAAGFEAYLTSTASDNPNSQQTYTPTTIYINSSTGDDDAGDGSSESPYATFHKAYTQSNGGDTINATGTFDWTDSDETGDASISGYTLAHDLIIQGAGPSNTIFQAASSDNTASMRVFTTSTGYTFAFNDLTIRYGKQSSSSYGGGGLLIYGTATIDGADISYNRATSDAGGGVDVRGQLTIQNSTIHHNVASYMGGGLNRSYYSSSGGQPSKTADTLDIINCTIAYNSVTQSVAYLEGGGVYFRRGGGSITNSTIAYNQVINGGSTHGVGTGYTGGDADLIGVVKLKNSIIAGNILGANGGDIGHRSSGNGYSTYEDNGGNIFGKTGYYIQGLTVGSTSWLDAVYGQSIDGTYVLQDGEGTTTGSLYLDDFLQTNGNAANGTKTFGITSGSSIAINNGFTGSNGTVSVPSTDQREVSRVSSADIGAYEYDGTYTVEEPTTQAYSVVFSSVEHTQMNVSWTNGNAANRIVFAKAADSGTAIPVDETTYSANAAFGSGDQIGSFGWYAVYSGTGTSVTVTSLSQGTDYIFQVFEYNGSSGSENYLTDAASDNPNSQATTTLTTPATQAHTVAFSSVQYNQMNVSWTRGDGAKAVVFVKQADTGTATPVDDTDYTANTAFGSGTQVGSSGWYTVYNSTGTSVTVTGLTTGTDYIVQVFEYNESGVSTRYFADSASNNPNTQASLSVTEPTTQAHTVSFSSVGSSGFTASWTDGDGDGRIVFVKEASSGTVTPVDDTSYTANTAFGSGTQIDSTGWYTVYKSTGSSVTVTGLTAETTYSVQVFEYNSDGSSMDFLTDAASSNPNTQLTSELPPGETFETGDFSTYEWTFGGNADWTITSADKNSGTYSARSGVIGNSQSTEMQITLDIASDGNITFYRKVSSEGGYDKLYFYIDGVLKTSSWSGTQAWAQATYAVTAGERTFKWKYAKDGSATSGSDTAWVDDIEFPDVVAETYTLSYAAGDNGSLTGSTTQVIAAGEDGTAVTAVPATGYSFVNWSDESIANPRTDTSVSADASLTANFAINTYDLTYTAGDNGSIIGVASQTVNYGADGSQVTAVADEEYVFSQWSDAVATAARTDTGITEDLSVTATFIDQSALIYVNSSTGSDVTGDGTSGSPYKTFHQGYTAVLAGGTLDLTGTFDWTSAGEIGDLIIAGYTIAKDLTIRGQGADVTFVQAASADNKGNRRVFTIASGYTVTIQDLSIRYGKVTGYGNDGGGIRNSGVLTITNCDIYNNRTTGDSGGGIANRHTLTVNGSGVYNNVAYYMGGGIVNSYYVDSNGYLTITNSTIAYNQQTIAIAYTEGGGIHFRQGSGTITNSTIAYNTANGVGGVGMDDQNGTLTIKNTIIANNIKRGSSYPVDFGFRQSGYGNVVDNGNNIVGKSQYYTWEGSGDWTDENRDATFVLYGVGTTGPLNLDPSLAVNGNTNKTHSLGILAGSVALNTGGEGSNGDVSIPTTDMRGVARTGDYDIGSFEYASASADSTAPTVSDVSVAATATGATITWITNEAASSQVRFDANTIRSTGTPLYNSSSRVTSHSVTLSNLIACSKYYYIAVSRDADENVGESEGDFFYTTGCAGNASVSNITEASATPEAGGAVAHTDGNLTFGLTIPTSFSEDPTDFQVKSLNRTTALASLNTPTNYTSIGDAVFDVKALEDPETTLSSFDSDVTVSLAYTDDELTSLDEDSLWIYRNDDSTWYALSACTVDSSANTVTCTTNSFSVFGLFGQSVSSSSSSNTGGVLPRHNSVVLGSDEEEDGVVSVPIQITDFVDLNDLTLGDWEYDVAEKMLDLRLIRGEVSNGQTYFNMYDLMDRAEVAVLAARYLGFDEDSEVEEAPFDDVPADSWFGPSVAYLKEIGIITGRSETEFVPSDYVSRSEFFKIMVKVYLHVHENLRPEWEDNMITVSDYFVDIVEGQWYVPYMYLAANKNLLSGYLEGDSRYVRPNQQVSRIECASIVTNLVYGSD